MLTKSQQIHEMVDMLPDGEQNLAFEMVKRLVLAWDPDYTKLTSSEKRQLEQVHIEIENGDTISHEELMKELGI
ncbi:MAG: hypothetical protein RSD63_10820 [Eubacterium sp.]